MDKKGPWWKPDNCSSIAWLGLFLPALACYLHFLSQHLNTYPEVKGSSIERLSAKLDEIVPVGAKVEMIADGFKFTEGTRWVHDEEADRHYLLFSDIPNNRIWKWEVPGSGEVVICEHGNRRVTRMEKNGTRTPLATHFHGRRLNSPNDVAFSKRGDLFFTDPPYGMPQRLGDPDYAGVSGVFRIKNEMLGGARAEEQVAPDPELVEKDFAWPNGLAFSPDYTKLYLAVSSPEDPAWYVYDVSEEGELSNRRLFMDAKPMLQGGRIGAPDGLKVDEQGIVYAAAPGGVAVITPEGEHLGTILSGGTFVANVAIGGDGYLYMAATESIMRVKVLTKAASIPSV